MFSNQITIGISCFPLLSSKLSRFYRCSNIREDSRVTFLNDADYQILRMQIN